MSDSSFVPKTWCVYGVLHDEPCAMFFTARADANIFISECLESMQYRGSQTLLSIMVLVGVDGDAMTIEAFS